MNRLEFQIILKFVLLHEHIHSIVLTKVEYIHNIKYKKYQIQLYTNQYDNANTRIYRNNSVYMYLQSESDIVPIAL